MSSCGGASAGSTTFSCATSDTCEVPAVDDNFCNADTVKVDQDGQTLGCSFCAAGNC